MEKIYFVTSNKNKLKEAEDILELKLNQINLDLIEVQEIETAEVVKQKAKTAFDLIKKPILVEDTGLYIEKWNGFPGALIKWMLKTIGNRRICELLGKNRKAFVKTCFCLYNGKNFNIFTGELKGKIPNKPKGKSGFGWDPIFQPNNYSETFAQMSQQEKNKISMRKIALTKLKDFLKNKKPF